MSDLRGNNKHGDVKLGGGAKVISAIIVAVAICAAGAYAAQGGLSIASGKQRVASSDLSSPAPSSQPQ